MTGRSFRAAVAVAVLSSVAASAMAGDWPMWRGDARRRGVSDEQLPASLHLQWVLELPEPRPAWPTNQNKLHFDRLYEPVVMGKRLFIPSMASDKVTAHDTDTGAELWSFFTGGPVRLAPVAADGRLYFVSDDGHLYCLDAADGSLLWKFRGGPSSRVVLGNDRLVNAWPARGGPVLLDGKIYFGASIWPFMGIFLHALDAESGEVIWTNSGNGADYLTQQHNSPAFSGVSPQGYLAATEDYLVVAGGRTVPAVYDRHTGKFLHFNVASRDMGSKGGGGYEVTVGDNFYLNRGAMYRLDNGKFVAKIDALIVSDLAIIGKDAEGLRGYRPGWEVVESKDRKGNTTSKVVVKKAWTLPVEKKIERAFIKSGSRVYCSGEKGSIFAVDMASFEPGARISWRTQIPDRPLNMISGDGKLFVTTDLGRVYCFGGAASGQEVPASEVVTLIVRGATWRYLDDGSDQGTRWRLPDFDDSDWSLGEAQLGYGDGDEATTLDYGADKNRKPITCYFRHAFEASGDHGHEAFALRLLADDGAVVYLNGEEIARVNMPSGEIDHETLADSTTDDEFEEIRLSETPSLRAGTNVLAVEVHQRDRTSSDLSLDLELTARKGRLQPRPVFPEDRWTAMAGNLLRRTGASEGYCLALGLGSGRLAEEIASQSQLHVVVIDPDAARIEAFRRRLDGQGIYGTRLAAIVADPLTLPLPPYMADLVVSEAPERFGFGEDVTFARSVFHVLRPYSGVACFRSSGPTHRAFASAVNSSRLEHASLKRAGGLTLLRRLRPPDGAGEWTHQNADAANARVSSETLVRAPLGLLWFGGPSNDAVLPRHGHGPTPQVVGGRLFIEGRNVLRAMDIYTGRLLWERTLKDVGKWYDNTAHQPGANLIGSNYVSVSDGVYVVHEKRCLRLDPATGETISKFVLPGSNVDRIPGWGYIGVWNDILVAGAQPTDFSSPDFTADQLSGIKDGKLKEALALIDTWKDFEPLEKGKNQSDHSHLAANLNKLLIADDMVEKISERLRIRKETESIEKELADYLATVPGRRSTDHKALVLKRDLLNRLYGFPKHSRKEAGVKGSLLLSGSKKLVAMDRYSGKALWEREAHHEIRHNAIAIGGGIVFCIDRMSAAQANFYKRRGLPYDTNARVAAFDIHNGREVWATSERVFGTWLGYSVEHDVLLQAGSRGRDRAPDEVGQGMVAYRGTTGEVLWQNDEKYGGPCLLLEDTLITQGYGRSEAGFALDLLTGAKKMRPHPTSGGETAWSYMRNYGCNTAIGCPTMLTFRSAAAGYYDLIGDSGTGNLGGFRSGCTSNLIPAGGIVSAPDYTRTCTCSYQNQASLGLVHMPEVEMWTFTVHENDGRPVKSLGLNFGAPGDRRAPDGTFWLDSPSVGGDSPDVPVEVISTKAGDVRYVRHHSSSIRGGDLEWVAASAFEGSGEIAVKLLTPRRVVIPNEVVGGSPLRGSNATLSAKVPAARLPQGGENFTSLTRGNDRASDAKVEVLVAGYDELSVDSVTVEFWVRTNQDFDYVDARTSGRKEQHGFVIDNRQLRVRYFITDEHGDNNADEVKIESKSKIADNRWTHVAFTYDAPSGVGTLYKDGKAVGRHDGPDRRPFWWDVPAPDLKIGSAMTAGSFLDELRICRVALDPGRFLLNGESRMDSGVVVGHWRMESPPRAACGDDAGMVYTVRLLFAEIGGLGPGERVFDVRVQGELVLEDFDIAAAAGGPWRSVTREATGVPVRDYLRVRLEPKKGAPPLMNGLQVTAAARGF